MEESESRCFLELVPIDSDSPRDVFLLLFTTMHVVTNYNYAVEVVHNSCRI